MKQIETVQTTPEELLKILDLQMAMQRAQRGSAGRNRTMFLVGGLLFIVIGAGIALLVLTQMLSDLPHSGHQPTAQAAQGMEHGNF